MKELEAFSPRLAQRHQILAVNKIDLLKNEKAGLKDVEKLAKDEGLPFFAISALKEKGLRKLVNEIAMTLEQFKEKSE